MASTPPSTHSPRRSTPTTRSRPPRATAAFKFHLDIHLAKEDTHLYRIVRERISLPEQGKLVGVMAGSVPQERFPEVVAWMFPLIGDDDRENMLRIWNMVMPPEAFAGAAHLVHNAVGDDWADSRGASRSWPPGVDRVARWQTAATEEMSRCLGRRAMNDTVSPRLAACCRGTSRPASELVAGVALRACHPLPPFHAGAPVAERRRSPARLGVALGAVRKAAVVAPVTVGAGHPG